VILVNFNIEKKMLLGIIIITSLIFFIFIFLVISKINSIILVEENQHYDLLIKSVDFAIEKQLETAKTAAFLLSENMTIKQLFNERKRDAIIEILLNSFEKLKPDVAQIHFHLPDSTSFLRLHMPQEFGDDLTDHRFMVNDANEYKIITQGLEKGLGGLGFRTVVPIFFQDIHLGTVEYGIPLNDNFLNSLENNLGGKFYFKDEKIQFSDLYKIELSQDKKNTFIYIPLNNYSGEYIGYILSIQNRNEISALLKNTTNLMIIFSLISIFLLSLFTYSFLKNIITMPIKNISKTITFLIKNFENNDYNFPKDEKIQKLLKRNDEIGVISNAVKRSYYDLSVMVRNLKKYSTKLEYQSNKLNGIINTIPDLLFVYDKNGLYKEVYTYDESFLFLPKEELINSKISIKDILSKRDFSRFMNAVKQSLKTKEMKSFEYELLIKNERKFFEARLVALSKNEIISLSRDITQKKLIEKNLIEAKKYAEKSNKLKSIFVSKITHDLKTPLHGISGLAKILKEKEQNQESQEYLQLILYSVENMVNIINNLLDISKIENNNLELSNTQFNLKEELENFVNFFKQITSKQNNNLNLIIQKNIPEIVVGDKYRLIRIIQNFLSNSNKFTENGKIDIRVSLENFENDEYIINFAISDTGEGIKKEKLPMIFKPYYQAHAFDGRGTGLGMSLSKELIMLMKGNINIESEEEKGTKITFTLKFNKNK